MTSFKKQIICSKMQSYSSEVPLVNLFRKHNFSLDQLFNIMTERTTSVIIQHECIQRN